MRKGRDSGERFQTLDNYTERNIYSVYHNEHKCGQLQNTNSSEENMGCKGFHSWEGLAKLEWDTLHTVIQSATPAVQMKIDRNGIIDHPGIPWFA